MNPVPIAEPLRSIVPKYVRKERTLSLRTVAVEVVRSHGGWSQELLDHIAAGNVVVWAP